MSENKNKYAKLHYMIELTGKCNHRCAYCYNVWKLDNHKISEKELTTDEWKSVFKKLKKETGCTSVSLSGGEPTLREDFLEILDSIHTLKIEPVLISNGSNLTPDFIKECIKRGVKLFELPLSGPCKEIHNEIAGNDSWNTLINALVTIRSLGKQVVVVFVATTKNLPFFEDTLKLAIALDTTGLMLNRFNAGGIGIKHIDDLLPSAEEFERALEIANRYSQEYRYRVSSSIPVQPCIINMEKYPLVRSGYCVAGTDVGYYTIGPDGKVRICNHSPSILGNFLTEKFDDIVKHPEVEKFKKAIPDICRPCSMAKMCQGGCKAAAEVCYGSPEDLDPFLKKNLSLHPSHNKDHPAHFAGKE